MRESILFIAKVDLYLKNIYSELIEDFNVQLCNLEQNMLEETLNITDPNAVLLFLKEEDTNKQEIMNIILENNKTKNIPVIIMGDEMDVFKDKKIHYVDHSIDINDLKSRIFEYLQHKSVNVPEEKKHILVVDDAGVTLRSMKLILQDKYDVSIANSGMTALTSIGKQKPDLILLDYDMPICDGKQTLKMLRDNKDTKGIPVIFLTGIADLEKIKEALALKPQGYILKSSSKERILKEIEVYFNEQ